MNAETSQQPADDFSDDIFPPNFDRLRTRRRWHYTGIGRNPRTDWLRHWQSLEDCLHNVLRATSKYFSREISFSENYGHVYDLCQLPDDDRIPLTFRMTIAVLDDHMRSVIKHLTPLKGHRFLQHLQLERDHYERAAIMICQIMMYLSNIEPLLNFDATVKGRFDEIVLTALKGKLFRTLSAVPCMAPAPPFQRNRLF